MPSGQDAALANTAILAFGLHVRGLEFSARSLATVVLCASVLTDCGMAS